MPPVFGPGVAVTDPLEILRRQQRHHGLAVDHTEQRNLGAVEKGLQQHRMPGLEQAGTMGAGGVPIRCHHHAFAGRQASRP